jgi:DNA-directed RNA polymerase I, II, and III subunit RPABC4
MSREAYVAPTLQPQSSLAAISDPTTQYLCGECNSKVQLKKGDPIRCKDCGHRVLYKERTKRYIHCNDTDGLNCVVNPLGDRMVQFEAR